MASQSLFTTADLTAWLGFDVDSGRGAVVERVVWGWLVEVLTDNTDRPTPVPPQLFSWALELAAIAHENPAGLSSKAFGDVSEAYGSERRDEILEAVAGSDLGSGTPSSGAMAPRGSFPPPPVYPDPARVCRTRW